MRYLFFFLLILLFFQCRQNQKDDYLLRFGSDDKFGFGYISIDGDTIIPAGTYAWCYTDTFRTFAIVAENSGQLVAIDRQQNQLYEVFNYDNGPDYASDGLFRIFKNGKIGYAALDGRIVIEPQFSCAFPFNDGRAKVAYFCRDTLIGEHRTWQSTEWFYIDLSGQPLRADSLQK